MGGTIWILTVFFLPKTPRVPNFRFLVHLDQLPSLGVRRLLSVVCKLFTFQASSAKPLGRLEPNLAGMLLGWSSTKLLFFVPVGYSIWLPGPIIWLSLTLDPMGKMFQNASSLKPLGQLKPNCPGMIIGRSSINFCFLCQSEIQDGHHRNT